MMYLSFSVNWNLGYVMIDPSLTSFLDDDHLYGMRLRLWTAAINWHVVHPPGDMSVESRGGMIL
jgi:hypothetical protein